MKYIKELTVEQKARIPEWIDKWIKIGLKTGETDWETFEKYIEVCYQKANIPFPEKIIRVSSPLVGALASSIASSIVVDSAVIDAVIDAVGGAVIDAIKNTKLTWHYWLGGQFWVGGWCGSPSYVSFFTDVCNLEPMPHRSINQI